MREVVVLDACVLYSAHLRDFLLHLAHQKLFYPRWSDRIHDEWIRNVLKNRPDLRLENFNRLRVLMNDAFPSANVIPRNSLLKGITLPDPDDVHVLLSAIQCKADLIVTFNLKDFPTQVLANHGIKALHPDDFLAFLIQHFPKEASKAFLNQVEHLKNPPIPIHEIFANFRQSQLNTTVTLLEELLK